MDLDWEAEERLKKLTRRIMREPSVRMLAHMDYQSKSLIYEMLNNLANCRHVLSDSLTAANGNTKLLSQSSAIKNLRSFIENNFADQQLNLYSQPNALAYQEDTEYIINIISDEEDVDVTGGV